MPNPDPIEDEFVKRAKAIVREALDVDPEKLPAMPLVTLSFIGIDQRDHQTGPAMEVTWKWIVRLYIPLKSGQGSDFGRAQNELKRLLPPLFKVIRDDRSIGGTCSKATLTDIEAEPDYDVDQKRMTKELMLRALTEEA